MKYLIFMGSSLRNIQVECSYCGKKQVWMKAIKIKNGYYKAVCGACLREQLRSLKIPNKY